MSAPVWKGNLTLGELTIAVRLFSGPSEQHVELKQIHRHCNSPVGNQLYCKSEEKVIPRDHLAKAIEQDGRLIPLPADQLATIAPQRSESLPLGFIAADTVDPLFFEASYYLAPELEDSDYAAVLEVMRNEKVCAITKLVMQRERWLLIRPGARGLIAHTLYFSHEAKRMSEFRTFPAPVVNMRKVFDAMEAARVSFDPEATMDEYPARLYALVTKIDGMPDPPTPAAVHRKPAQATTSRRKKVA